jgi:hypothetical protein
MRRDQLRVLQPCPESFDAMRGRGASRFCERCTKHVHNLSDMTKRDAEALLDRHAGESICIRYRFGRDGQVQFRPPRRARAAFVAVLSLAMAGCAGYLEEDDLQVPDAMVCHDAEGYAVPCDRIDDGVTPYMEPTSDSIDADLDEDRAREENLPEEEVLTDAEIDALKADLEDELADDTLERGCPSRGTYDDDEIHATMGVIDVGDERRGTLQGRIDPDSPASRRAQRRAERRERRAQRNLANASRTRR